MDTKLFDDKPRRAAHLLPVVAALQQVGRLVVLQVADAGVRSSAQQQSQDLLLVGVTMETGCHVQSCVAVSLEHNGRREHESESALQRIPGILENRFKSQGGVCATHLQVDKVLHVGQSGPQQETHELHVPLLYSQMQNSLVAFDFLE